MGNAAERRHCHHQGEVSERQTDRHHDDGRAPNNTLCPNNNDPDTIILPFEDAAFDAVAAASNGFVKVGPKYFVPDCATSYLYANDSDYTTAAANSLAMQIAPYFVTNP
jgi:hypothetical protein